MALLFLDASETEVMAQVKEYLRLNAYFYPTLGLLFILIHRCLMQAAI